MDGIAGEIDKAAKSVSSDIANVTINPLVSFTKYSYKCVAM